MTKYKNYYFDLVSESLDNKLENRLDFLNSYLEKMITSAPGQSRAEKLNYLWKNNATYPKLVKAVSILQKPNYKHADAYKAEFLADRYYIRFGDFPKSGKSFNFLHGVHEIGVSAYSVKWDISKHKWKIIEDGLNDSGFASLYELADNVLNSDTPRPIYLVSGQELNDIGNDGEPMLDVKNVKIIKKLLPSEFYSNELGDEWDVDLNAD